MRLPSPARAATIAGVLLAATVLLLAADLAVVQMAGEQARAVPFTVQDETFTAVGMRITNAGTGDLVQAYEMFANAACGYTYRAPPRVPYVPGNNSTSVYFVASNGTAWTYGDLDIANRQVAGNVTFYVLESVYTPDMLRGTDTPDYLKSRREADLPVVRIVNRTTGSEDEAGVGDRVIVQFWAGCSQQGHAITIERGPHPGADVRLDFDPGEPWLGALPPEPGIDFLYVLRADEQNDNETYAVLAEGLRTDAGFWPYSMMHATVFDGDAIVPDRVLRTATIATLGTGLACLALALRRTERPAPPGPTDAGFALAAAGESHLLRLRRTSGLVGALLVPILAAASYLLFELDYTPPSTGWTRTIGVLVVALDAALLALWGLAFWRVHQDLRAWRRAWNRLDATDLDAL